jgi:hypothetical protein
LSPFSTFPMKVSNASPPPIHGTTTMRSFSQSMEMMFWPFPRNVTLDSAADGNGFRPVFRSRHRRSVLPAGAPRRRVVSHEERSRKGDGRNERRERLIEQISVDATTAEKLIAAKRIYDQDEGMQPPYAAPLHKCLC